MIASIVLLIGAGLISMLCITLWGLRSVLYILAVVLCAGALGLLLTLGLGGFFKRGVLIPLRRARSHLTTVSSGSAPAS